MFLNCCFYNHDFCPNLLFRHHPRLNSQIITLSIKVFVVIMHWNVIRQICYHSQVISYQTYLGISDKFRMAEAQIQVSSRWQVYTSTQIPVCNLKSWCKTHLFNGRCLQIGNADQTVTLVNRNNALQTDSHFSLQKQCIHVARSSRCSNKCLNVTSCIWLCNNYRSTIHNQ